MKRRLPKGADLRHAEEAVKQNMTKKTAKQLQHLWVSREKRRTHKRERREARRETKDEE